MIRATATTSADGARRDRDFSWYWLTKHWQKCVFKKQVSGMGGLASLAIKDYILHIYVCKSYIMHFLYLKLFFLICGKPGIRQTVSWRISEQLGRGRSFRHTAPLEEICGLGSMTHLTLTQHPVLKKINHKIGKISK